MKLDNPTLLGIAALITALGSVISSILGVRKARRDERAKAEQECIERLRDTRAESEKLAQELHELRMKEFQ